jgi:transposase
MPGVDAVFAALLSRIASLDRELQRTSDELQGANVELKNTQDELHSTKHRLKNTDAENALLREQVRLARHKRFGTSSEKTVGQEALVFNEAEALADPAEPEPELEVIAPAKRRGKKKGLRASQLKDLPVEKISIGLTEAEKACPQCGDLMEKMSEVVKQEIKVVPAQKILVQFVREVCACRNCQKNDVKTPIVTAPMPNRAFPRSLASPSLVAYFMVQKFADGMPLYRQEQSCLGLGNLISRQTMANWIITGATVWLAMLYGRMKALLLLRDHLQADETVLQVLREPGRAAQTDSRMWLYRTGRQAPPIVLFEYQQTRDSDHPERFLRDFRGYLQVDGYQGYAGLSPNVTIVGCWAHARRGFTDALAALPSELRDRESVAKVGLKFCNELFAIEARLKDATAEERHAARQIESRALLDKISAWLDKAKDEVTPKCGTGQAIKYCRNQWKNLTAFLADGRLEIDNNRSERSIKNFVIGRKNWMFSNSPKGADASAIVYSIIETAKENGLNPFEYLTHVFEKLPTICPDDQREIDKLLPWSESLPESCRAPDRTD